MDTEVMEIYPASKVIIAHPEKDEILLIKRSLEPTTGYELAGGRVEIDFISKKAESLEECVCREAYEELGTQIETLKYIASYYFFWTIKENACSVCAVFFGTVSSIGHIKQGIESCGNIYPIWVKIDDILNDKIYIEKQHVGLSKILKDLAFNLRNGNPKNLSVK